MVFGLFKKKDPVCGMKEEEGKGVTKEGKWFCSESCLRKYDKTLKESYLFSTKRSPRGDTRIPLNSGYATVHAETRSVLNKYKESKKQELSGCCCGN